MSKAKVRSTSFEERGIEREKQLWTEINGWMKLKRKKPAHTDIFELQALERPDRHEDVVARIKRVSDGKVFLLGLSWLCCKDETCEAFTLLDGYGVWHTNY